MCGSGARTPGTTTMPMLPAMVPLGYEAVTMSIGCSVVGRGTMRPGICAQPIGFAMALISASLRRAFESQGICDPVLGDGIVVLPSLNLSWGLGGTDVYSSAQLKWHERTWFAISAFLNVLSLSAFVDEVLGWQSWISIALGWYRELIAVLLASSGLVPHFTPPIVVSTISQPRLPPG
jgi:hypothetical protein